MNTVLITPATCKIQNSFFVICIKFNWIRYVTAFCTRKYFLHQNRIIRLLVPTHSRSRNVIEKFTPGGTYFVQACARAGMLAQPIQIGDVM